MQFFNEVFNIVSIMFILLIVMAMAYITTRYIGMNNIRRFKNKNIKLLEVMPIGYQKYLYIVKVTDKHMLLSVSKDDIKLLDILDSEKIVINDDNGLIGKDFKNILESVIRRQKK